MNRFLKYIYKTELSLRKITDESVILGGKFAH